MHISLTLNWCCVMSVGPLVSRAKVRVSRFKTSLWFGGSKPGKERWEILVSTSSRCLGWCNSLSSKALLICSLLRFNSVIGDPPYKHVKRASNIFLEHVSQLEKGL